MSATVTTFPATGAFTVAPTAPFTEATGQLLLAQLNGSGSGTARTPALAVATSSGTVTAGANCVSILPSSDFAGTVLGAVIPPSVPVTFAVTGTDTIGAIAYTISAGSLTILTLR